MTKTVLITGASSGFGEACAKKFIAAGDWVILGARRLAPLAALQQLYPNAKMHCAYLDVCDNDSITVFLQELPEAFQAIDVLINNAGLALGTQTAQQASLEEWETMIDTNIKGLVRMTHKILPGMVQRNRGHIINMGSIAGSWPYPGSNTYGGSKAFVQQFTRGLRADILGKKIRVTNLAPGLSETNFSVVRMNGDASKAAEVYKNTQPLVAEDIANITHWVTTVPEHVNINEVEVMPTCQAWGPLSIDRTMV